MRFKQLIGALVAAAVLATPGGGEDPALVEPGRHPDVRPDGAEREPQQHVLRLRLRRARPLQQAVRARAGARDVVDARLADAVALQAAQEREVPRRHADDGRRRRVLVRARAEARVEHEGLRAGHQGDEEDRRLHRRDHHRRSEPGAAARPGRRQDHEQGLVDEEQRRQSAELRAEGRDLRGAQHQRHRASSCSSRARRTCGPCWWSTRTGGTRRRATSPRSSTSRSSRTARALAALLSGEIDFVLDPPTQDIPRLRQDPKIKIADGTETADHLLRLRPVARRVAVHEREGQEPVQGQARPPGDVPGDRHRGDPPRDDARACRTRRGR